MNNTKKLWEHFPTKDEEMKGIENSYYLHFLNPFYVLGKTPVVSAATNDLNLVAQISNKFKKKCYQ
ncbi:hypothetical protein GCM10028791_20650 [Echinicola sediminis]